jgi:hypothetical protein
MAYSKATELALKAKKVYSTIGSSWHCYYHALSGDELKEQIITIVYKPKDQMNSWSFKDLSNTYKMYEDQGLVNFIKEKYKVLDEELPECVNSIKEFLDDAKIEYTGKPFFNKEITI